MQCMFSSHLRALQFASAATIVTAGLIALPSLAENLATDKSADYYASYIAKRFQRVGAEQIGTYDNASIATSAFDFAQYTSNTCYSPTENDIAACKQEFGPFYNLKDTMTRGTLSLILGGSRSVGVVGIGKDLHDAEQLAQEVCEKISGPVRFRDDIATVESIQKRVDLMSKLRGK